MTDIDVNLLLSNTFRRTIHCMIPGEGVDAEREIKFVVEFEAIDIKEWEDMGVKPRSVALERVVKSIPEGLPGATLKDGTVLSARDVGISNPFTADAIHSDYTLYITANGRNAAASEALKTAERKNSRRSRGR